MWIFVPIQEFVARLLESFKEFPPAGGSSLSVDQALATVTDPTKATHPIAA